MRFEELEVNDTLVKSVVAFAAAVRATFQAAEISENAVLCSFQRFTYEACAFLKATEGPVLPSKTMSMRTAAACMRCSTASSSRCRRAAVERTCQLRQSNIVVWGEAVAHKLKSSTVVGIQERGEAKIIPCVQRAAQRLYRLSTLQCNLPLTVRALHARDVLF